MQNPTDKEPVKKELTDAELESIQGGTVDSSVEVEALDESIKPKSIDNKLSDASAPWHQTKVK